MPVDQLVASPGQPVPQQKLQCAEGICHSRAIAVEEEDIASQAGLDQGVDLPLDEDPIGRLLLCRPHVCDDENPSVGIGVLQREECALHGSSVPTPSHPDDLFVITHTSQPLGSMKLLTAARSPSIRPTRIVSCLGLAMRKSPSSTSRFHW